MRDVTIVVGTIGQSIMRSEDNGQTWARIGPRREGTLLELRLGTARRHQIRVQLAESGCPIVGDLAHGGPRSAAGRLCLHATRLAFEHPVTRRPVAFESAPPGDWV